MRARRWVLGLLGLATGCNFDAAFQRYCKDNPQCQQDSGTGGNLNGSPDSGSGQKLDGGSGWGQLPMQPPRSCLSNAQCNTPSEICHPFTLICLLTCASAVDCPPWLGVCTEIVNPFSGVPLTAKVCLCTGASACNSYASGFTCHPGDGICEKLCSGPQDCTSFGSPRSCDLQTGWCVYSPPLPPCVSNADCPSPTQPRCDPGSFVCVGCLSAQDCIGWPGGLTQCSLTGACVAP
jgi:hypothetical protein